MLLCSDGDSSRAVHNALQRRFGTIRTILEPRLSQLGIVKKRAKRLGYVMVIGQILFVALIVPILRMLAQKRIAEIKKEFELVEEWSESEIFRVASVNSEETRSLLRSLQPTIIVVNGTQIISEETLTAVNVPFLNMHAGITPAYRGVHGGYWALIESRPGLVGTTIHLVDKGIDTGKIIQKVYFSVGDADNFATYPYLHTAYGIGGLLDSIDNVLKGHLRSTADSLSLPSKLRTHPTIWGYLYNRMVKNVR
ncbi:formyl transferase [soil metagenome]